MWPWILYTPLLIVLLVLFRYALRTTIRMRGRTPARKLALLFGGTIIASLVFMLAIDEPWAPWVGIGIAAAVVVPLITPMTVVMIAMLFATLRGKPIRWN